MAERRMFAKTIVTSDAFLDMPLSARCLYFTLGMFADDDGFVNNPKSIMRQVGACTDDLNLLFAKRFILSFESGVIVIKHWRIHNYIRNDRYKETKYLEEKASLMLDEKGAYTKNNGVIAVRETVGIPSDIPMVDQRYTQDRIGEDRIGEDRIGKDSIGEDIDASPAEPAKPSKPQKHKYGEYKNVLLTDEEYEKLQNEFPSDYEDRIERLSSYIASKGDKYKSHLATIRNWARNDRDRFKQDNDEMATTNPFLKMLDELQR